MTPDERIEALVRQHRPHNRHEDDDQGPWAAVYRSGGLVWLRTYPSVAAAADVVLDDQCELIEVANLDTGDRFRLELTPTGSNIDDLEAEPDVACPNCPSYDTERQLKLPDGTWSWHCRDCRHTFTGPPPGG